MGRGTGTEGVLSFCLSVPVCLWYVIVSYVPDMFQCHEAALRRGFVWRTCKIKGEPTFECQDHGPL